MKRDNLLKRRLIFNSISCQKILSVFILLSLIYIQYVSSVNLKRLTVNFGKESLERENEDIKQENKKLNKTITHQLEEIKNLNETKKHLEKESHHLKKENEVKTETIGNLYKETNTYVPPQVTTPPPELTPVDQPVDSTLPHPPKQKGNDQETKDAIIQMKGILTQMNQFHEIFQQMKMQMERQKDLKNLLNEKVKEVSQSEFRVREVYSQIQSDFKNNLDTISKKVQDIEQSNYEINQKLFQIDKETEKEKIEENLSEHKINPGLKDISLSNNKFLILNSGSDCRNRKSCNVCVEDPRCVWCSIDRSCVNGSQDGPVDGSCALSFEYASCSLDSY
jgi:septal ring factor EnvC (AmiA/AmiB activator)